jgi:hypothetical protein
MCFDELCFDCGLYLASTTCFAYSLTIRMLMEAYAAVNHACYGFLDNWSAILQWPEVGLDVTLRPASLIECQNGEVRVRDMFVCGRV